MLFLAYELGYWFNHWLSHKRAAAVGIPQSAPHRRSADPADQFPRASGLYLGVRQHPRVLGGDRQRSRQLLFGDTAYQYALSDTNIILVLFIHVYVHLQHSHVWISFRGVLGRIFVSPAHHQVHHSANPKHFNKNFGSCLALWDWMFGTLYVPGKEREPLTFGFAGQPDAHTVKGELVDPFDQRRRSSLAAMADAADMPAVAGCGAQAGLVNCADAQAHRHRQRQDAEGLSLRPERSARAAISIPNSNRN